MSRFFTFCATLATAVWLAGCGGDREATVYRVPKEAAPAPAAAAAPSAMASQTLPEGLVNQSGNPAWEIPAEWVAKEASAMRRASFTLPGAGAAVDIAITSFPGDVGGPLANVNRWLGQLNLPPFTAGELANALIEIETASGPGTLVSLNNGTEATLAVTLFHAGNSWFFKMTGPRALVEDQREAFLTFARSTDFGAADPS